ncbi:MAG TPA: malto-oligosyltrehalose synthase [Candidatus Binataceae bacterium]|nr:malto-oligosyltrehalose synthase [Candidatus Binataceae bacterium]
MTEPRSTYRIQLHRGFTFDDAAAITDYLASLGISHLYCSPYLQAAPGSMHGYDVVDCRCLNEELGGAPAHERMHIALLQQGLGQILDIVPNHMAIVTPDNPWWWDVLENGPSSAYASYFDVDWETPERRLRNTVLLPVLGDQYGFILDRREIKLERDGVRLNVRYYESRFPVAPRSLGSILENAAKRCGSEELAFLADAFSGLPLATATDRESVSRRHRDKNVIQSSLERLMKTGSEVSLAIDAEIGALNEDQQALHSLLERQNYRLSYWRAASRELGYRRFFDINTLAGLRMEDERVFEDTHFLPLRWLTDGTLDGVRIDHIDGLREPAQYLSRLRKYSPNGWILVEKILMPGERLHESWPVEGTTGYDFISRVGGLFVNRETEAALTQVFTDFTGESADYAKVVVQKKKFIMSEILGSDLGRLTELLVDICEQHPHHRDYTRHEVHEAIREFAANLPVYRTYVSALSKDIHTDDQRYLDQALDAAKAGAPQLDSRLFDFLADILSLKIQGALESELAMRFQQFTGPVMAKSVEDTAFYCFNRLTSLNEVGCDPARFGTTVDEFHRENAFVQEAWPLAMLATSTHDTKRSEDVRSRISLLSEIPERWSQAVNGWAEMNRLHWDEGARDANAEYLLYQTLIGTWPIDLIRIREYMLKAAREAKLHTSWTQPNEAYESQLAAFVERILGDEKFLNDLEAFVEPLIWPGRINSLAQTLLKLTSPGVPDFYQGSELWDLTLVDPDNRRPVDYALRRRLLSELSDLTLAKILDRADEGLPKLWVTNKALALRARHPDWFGKTSSYEPIMARGPASDHVVAFARLGNAITIVPRLTLKLNGGWKNTTLSLPEGVWRNEFTGGRANGGDAAIATLFDKFPVALLSREKMS